MTIVLLFHKFYEEHEEVGGVLQKSNVGVVAGIVGEGLWVLFLHLLQQGNKVDNRRTQIIECLADIRYVHPVTATADARQSHRKRISKSLVAQV